MFESCQRPTRGVARLMPRPTIFPTPHRFLHAADRVGLGEALLQGSLQFHLHLTSYESTRLARQRQR